MSKLHTQPVAIKAIDTRGPHKMVAVDKNGRVLYTIKYLDGPIGRAEISKLFDKHCERALRVPHGYRLVSVD